MTAVPTLGSANGIAARKGPRPAATVRKLARVMVVAALLAAVSALALVVAYRPLDHVGGIVWAGQLSGGPRGFTLGPAGTDLRNTFGSELVVPPMPHGGRLGLVVDLHNRSPLPVTVLGVEPFLLDGSSRGTQLFVEIDGASPVPSLRPARRFTVLAHETRTVGLAVDVPSDCRAGAPGSTITSSQVRLRYRFAGIPRTRTIQLHELAVSLAAPPTCDADNLR